MWGPKWFHLLHTTVFQEAELLVLSHRWRSWGQKVKELGQVHRAGKCPSSGSQWCLLTSGLLPCLPPGVPPPRGSAASGGAAGTGPELRTATLFVSTALTLIQSVSSPQPQLESCGKPFLTNTSVTWNYKEMLPGEFQHLSLIPTPANGGGFGIEVSWLWPRKPQLQGQGT